MHSDSFHVYKNTMVMPFMKLTRNFIHVHLSLMVVEKPHMAIQHALRAYLQYTASMVCAMGFNFSGLVSHQIITSKF